MEQKMNDQIKLAEEKLKNAIDFDYKSLMYKRALLIAIDEYNQNILELADIFNVPVDVADKYLYSEDL
jgi:hypothetical protein